MKRILLVLFIVLFAGSAFASWDTESPKKLNTLNFTTTVVGSFKSINITTGDAYGFRIRAQGQILSWGVSSTDATMVNTLNTAEVYLAPSTTVLPKNSVLYFKSLGSVPATAEITYWYK